MCPANADEVYCTVFTPECIFLGPRTEQTDCVDNLMRDHVPKGLTALEFFDCPAHDKIKEQGGRRER